MRVLIAWLGLISLIGLMPLGAQEKQNLEAERKPLALIVKIDGKAKVLSKKSIKKHTPKPGEALFEGDKLIAYSGTKVLVELKDGSTVILNERSELFFIDAQNLKQSAGEVYYKIEPREALQELKIETPFSIMGIKGTEFIVDASGKGKIALNEGLIGIESLNADFELHKAKMMAEYEKYKGEQNRAFESYKAECEEESISYLREFDLEAGRVLHFAEAEKCLEACESQVREETMSSQYEERFKMYQEIARRR